MTGAVGCIIGWTTCFEPKCKFIIAYGAEIVSHSCQVNGLLDFLTRVLLNAVSTFYSMNVEGTFIR